MNNMLDAEIVEDDNKDIILRKIESLKTVVQTSSLVSEYKEVSEIDINLSVKEIAKDFLIIEKGYKAFRRNINLVVRTRKEFTAPALAYQKDCIAIEKDIVSVLEPYSLRLKALKDKVEQEEARKQREAEEAEELRIDAIKKKIYDVKNLPLQHFNSSAQELTNAIESLTEVTPAVYEEFFDKAVDNQNFVIAQLQQARDNKILVENASKIKAEKDAETLQLKAVEDAKLLAEREEFEKKQADFQKKQDDFNAMQREQQEIFDRREAIKEANELQKKQKAQILENDKINVEKHDAMIIETMAVLNTYTEMIILIDDIIDGKIPNIKWVLHGNY